MPGNRLHPREHSWRGIFLVAITYIYFLIFAQFGFIKRLDALHLTATHLKAVMAAMALGGVLSSLFSSRIVFSRRPRRRLQVALLSCAVAALCAIFSLNLVEALLVAVLIGLALGMLTVTLVGHLPLWISPAHSFFDIALGVGLGYFCCNIPMLFNATPCTITTIVASLSVIAIFVAQQTFSELPDASSMPASEHRHFPVVLLRFTALVWFDSAAFFIIQNSPALKSGTWQGAAHLWRTGSIHLFAALGAAWMLTHLPFAVTVGSAFAALAAACLLLSHPASAGAAAVLYPAGVSLYSVALVAWPAYLLAAPQAVRDQRAGVLYAIAGWLGSALGIGMAQHLHRVPLIFVAIAATAFIFPLFLRYRREVIAVVLVGITSWGIQRIITLRQSHLPTRSLTAVQRGRRVYIAEGCINCHSQYVRPHSSDVEIWGPVGNIEDIRRQRPPLIGNRRQGPDLANVGSRRSPLWLRIHQIDPRTLSYHSIMPSYAYLFREQSDAESRGDDLVAYLSSLKSADSYTHLRQVSSSWHPTAVSISAARGLDGAQLYRNYCSTCHNAGGYVRTHWHSQFHVLPPDLSITPLPYLEAGINPAQQQLALARIIKFGILESDMAGHEYLSEAKIIALAKQVQVMQHSAAEQKITIHHQ